MKPSPELTLELNLSCTTAFSSDHSYSVPVRSEVQAIQGNSSMHFTFIEAEILAMLKQQAVRILLCYESRSLSKTPSRFGENSDTDSHNTIVVRLSALLFNYNTEL